MYIVFFIFLILITLPLSARVIISYTQSKLLIKDVNRALHNYFDANCDSQIEFRAFSLTKQDFLRIGGPATILDFEYLNGSWKPYSDEIGGASTIMLTIEPARICSSHERGHLIYDHTAKQFIFAGNPFDHEFRMNIIGGFESYALIILTSIAVGLLLLICLIWFSLIYSKTKVP